MTHRDREASPDPRGRPRADGRAVLDGLLAEGSAHALEARLRAWSFLSWTFFRARRRERRRLPLPAPEPLPAGAAGPAEAWRVRLGVPAGSAANHLELTLPAAPDERFVGFGERFHAVDQRGSRLETWTEEGAIGFGERLSGLLTALGVSWNPFPKGPTTAYKPLPWLLSSRGYAVLAWTSLPVFFDVCASRPDKVTCEFACPEVDLLVLTGSPMQLVQGLVALTGRPPGLPDWALAPWHDAVGGQREVERVMAFLREERIPAGAIWTEDWQGGRYTAPWLGRYSPYDIFPVYRRPCARLYPDMPGLIRALHDKGLRFLTYYYPYVAAIDPDYEGLARDGAFVQDGRGRPATVRMLWYRTGQIDLTHPEGRAFARRELEAGLALGVDGWMGDFGEYTPLESVTHSGERGVAHRNRYPGLWAGVQAEAIRAAGREGDAVFFSRSSSIGQQAVTPLFWSGDSNTDFERWDGLPSNLRGLLSAGLSGMPVWTADVGGYTSLWTRARDRETLARWAELGAFLAVMRTHHGTHPRRSVQPDHDRQTRKHYAMCARLHAALFPLRRALVDEATRTGAPVCRALLLHHADDAEAWAVEDAFLLGEHLLVAPILERGARGRAVYLPRGHRWVDLWRGIVHAGGQRVHVPAPLGQPPLFLRADGLLPTFDTHVDTFDRRARVAAADRLSTLDDAEKSLALVLGPDWSGSVTLYDGTLVTSNDAAEVASPVHAGASSPPHALLPEALVATWTRGASGEGRNVAIRVRDRAITLVSPIQRRVTVYLAGA